MAPSPWTTHRTPKPHHPRGLTHVAFEKQRVAIEIDGKIHLRHAKKFEDDRYRQNALILGGWLVLRFTWKMLTEDPGYVVRTTRAALELADRFPTRPGRR